ncbi:hypothetical protein Pisl_1407 [Pyrobaculum islandicum DSM 4184]|uniref:Uncharacterized protein n=1 Tax=Pyrobaculum islandicum (strain DSM 4184 / JCM 9189 / GEO3) TaxID=384616 RepID=A1RUD4_PYRIL|nr:hypothetical protein [Pyrobaculum islandicum]ABL88566.1 hypothetical protein Pisl_1407 [Pyrobaculum islandicum DSM 4184]
MRGLSTVASFVVFLAAFTVVMFSIFYFYGLLREATQKGVAAIYSSITYDTAANISMSGGACGVGGGPYLYYVVTDSGGGLLYNGTSPPPCPPGRPGLYLYRAVRRDGGVSTAVVSIGGVWLSAASNASVVVLNDYRRTFALALNVTIYNPTGGYAVVTNITASLGAPQINCSGPPAYNQPVVVPPGGSKTVQLGAAVCAASYDFVLGGRPASVVANISARYKNLTLYTSSQPVATAYTAQPTRGNFTAGGGRCLVGYMPEGAVYYVLLSGSTPILNGTPQWQSPGYAVVPCPNSGGLFRYRVVSSSGSVVEVPVAVGRILAWAESNITVAYVNSINQTIRFDLYLRFTNPNTGFTPFNATYSLVYNNSLLSCSPTNGSLNNIVLQPGDTRAVYADTVACTVLGKFNVTNVGVKIDAVYTGGGYSQTLYSGVVGVASYAAAPNWVVVRVVWGSGAAAGTPGYGVAQFVYRRGLVSLLWTPAAAPPPPVCPATRVYLDTSLAPLLSASWRLVGNYNVTTLSMKIYPGWPEDYTVATLAPTTAPQQVSLVKAASYGSAQYSVYLGGLLQFNESLSFNNPVSLPAPLRWVTKASGPYWVTANASVAALCSYPLLNLTATPMSKLYSQTFSCGTTTYVEGFGGYCSFFGFDTTPPWLILKASNRLSAAYISDRVGNPVPSLYTEGNNGWGAGFINVTQWVGPVSAGSSFSIQYYLQAALSGTDYLQVNFFIDVNGDGRPDQEVIYYYSVNGRTPAALAYNFYGYAIPTTSILLTNFQNTQTTWLTLTIPQVYSSGKIVGFAVATYSPNGNTKVYWDNIKLCVLPNNIAVYTRGYSYTQVYIDPNTGNPAPSLATEVDAYGASGNPQTDWGAAIAVYKLAQPVPALGTTVSVWGLYQKDANDLSNNVAYVSVGVDANGDGQVDKEYILYRSDTGGGPGAIVSAFFKDAAGNPVYVCTVDTTGACAATDPRFVVVNLGAMTSGNSYTWSYTLNDQGAVVAIALAATDGSYYGEGYSGDVWVYWDNLQLQYSACPLPAGWSVLGAYAWQSYNYLLASGSVAVYRGLVAGGLTYVSNFTGVGAYAVFDSSLTPIFGVSISGSGFSALCGSSAVSLGSLPSAAWVELRPLSGLGDIIVRDQYGNILARYGCPYTAAPQYIGYKTTNTLKIYNITALG